MGGEEYSLERCAALRRELFVILIERRFGADSDVVVAHVLTRLDAEPGLMVRSTAIGRLETIAEKVLSHYEGCEIRECDRLDFLKAEDVWESARPFQNDECRMQNVEAEVATS